MILLFIGTTELIVIACVVLLIFGGKKIPELMHGLGKGVKSFKKGMQEVEDEIKSDTTDSESAPKATSKEGTASKDGAASKDDAASKDK